MSSASEASSHDVERVFVLGQMTHVQCDCGERFRGHSEKEALQAQFRHAWQKVRKSNR